MSNHLHVYKGMPPSGLNDTEQGTVCIQRRGSIHPSYPFNSFRCLLAINISIKVTKMEWLIQQLTHFKQFKIFNHILQLLY